MRKCRIVSGPRNGGKTSYLLSLGIKQGIVTVSEDARKDVRNLMDLADGSCHDFMVRGANCYMVSPGSFEWACKRLSEIERGDAVIDECGLIELRDKAGFHDSIVSLMEKEEVTLYVAVRDTFLPLFLSVFSPDVHDVIRI
ncbi:MAG: hypothetical protein ACI4NM_00900 [Bullifex sp.]